MAITEYYGEPLIPSFLYSSSNSYKKLMDFENNPNHITHSSPPKSPAMHNAVGTGGVTAQKSFVVQAPSEPGKIKMFSPAYYAACTAGGIFSCGLTHMAVTPLDLVKCNMQVPSFFLFIIMLCSFYLVS